MVMIIEMRVEIMVIVIILEVMLAIIGILIIVMVRDIKVEISEVKLEKESYGNAQRGGVHDKDPPLG